MLSDLRFAWRTLTKTPAFAAIAILTLALGIGLNTAIFSLINDLFLRGLPFNEPERLVHMYSNARERNLLELAVSIPRFQYYREAQQIFDGFGGENNVPFTLTGLGDPVQLFGGKVKSNYFDVLGVRPIRGRDFLPEEEEGNQGMRLVVIGLAVGIISAFALGRLITAQLYQVSAYNPALLAGATLLLGGTALVACLLPARRAALVDPVQALRPE
jgi:hypothetical protein